jgi:hypothetical protein
LAGMVELRSVVTAAPPQIQGATTRQGWPSAAHCERSFASR